MGQKCAKKRFIWALTNTDFLPRTNADFLLRIAGGGRQAFNWIRICLDGLGDFGGKRRDNSFIFLDSGGREHIIILSSLMELSCEGRKQVGVSGKNKYGFLLY